MWGLEATPDRRTARELLRRVCFIHDSQHAEQVLKPLLAGPVDWQYVLEYGARHRVLGLLEYGLRLAPPSCLERVPDGVKRHLLAAGLDAQVQTQKRLAFLKTLLASLAERGIRALVVKGLALAALYPEPRLRPADDIDLLVHEYDWPAIARIFQDLGLRPRPGRTLAPSLSPEHVLHLASYVGYGEVQYATPCDAMLEVHFRVFNVGIPALVEDAWQRQRIERVAGVELPTIGFEDAVFFHAVHMNWHRFCRLLWVADLHRMVRAWAGRMDWDWLMRRSRQQRMGRALACAIEVVQELGGPVPHVPPVDVLEPPGRLARARYRRRWLPPAVFELEQTSHFGFDPIWFYLRETADWPDRVRYLWHAMFPPRSCLGGQSRMSYLSRLTVDRFGWLRPVLAWWLPQAGQNSALPGGHAERASDPHP